LAFQYYFLAVLEEGGNVRVVDLFLPSTFKGAKMTFKLFFSYLMMVMINFNKINYFRRLDKAGSGYNNTLRFSSMTHFLNARYISFSYPLLRQRREASRFKPLRVCYLTSKNLKDYRNKGTFFPLTEKVLNLRNKTLLQLMICNEPH
jgi:hypothetical protein